METALARGDQVTTINRGISGPPAAGVQALHADRTDQAALRTALGSASFDAVIDTWSGAPVLVRAAAALLAGRAGHYGYVSSRSVYRWPVPSGADENAPVVDGDPADTGSADYAAAKRGGELTAADRGLSGAFNTVSKPGPATMETLLTAARQVTGARTAGAGQPGGLNRPAEPPRWAAPLGRSAGGGAAQAGQRLTGVLILSAAMVRITRPCGPIGLR